MFPCWWPLAPATGSVVHTSCGLDIAVPTAPAPASPIGGARAFGYGGAQQGNTGCGIEAAHKATCSQAKDAQPAWHGAESAQGCGVSGENVVGGRRLSPSDFDLESNDEGMMIGKARKAGRGHLEEKRIIHPMLVLQPRWWTVVGKSEVCTWIYYSGWHDMVFVQ